MVMRPLKPPSQGDPIRAGPIRAIAEAVNVLRNIQGGEGINVTLSDLGVLISLMPGVRKFLDNFLVAAIITEANGALPEDAQANVTYKARAMGEEGEIATARVPDLSPARVIEGVKVKKAAVGDVCFFFRWTTDTGDPRLWLVVLTEKVTSAACT